MARSDKLYQLLGVDPSASSAELKKAYRKMALKYHPDRNDGDADAEMKFKEVSEAYDILSDAQKKSEYDTAGFASRASQTSGDGFNPFGSDFFGSDIFEHFFGRRSSGHARSRAQRGARAQNITINIPITFNESVTGCTRHITLPRQVKCDPCAGRGGQEFKKCSRCHGSGFHQVHNAGMTFQTACSQCQGTGQIPGKTCGTCAGMGTYEKPTEIDVKIPAGINSDNQLRLSGMGHAGIDGAGDLFVNVNVQTHPKFQRSGKDIYSSVNIDVTQAVLGGTKEVETIYGNKKINIPAGIQPGNILNVPGYGMPDLSGQESLKGNFRLKIYVTIPTKINAAQKKLYEDLRSLE